MIEYRVIYRREGNATRTFNQRPFKRLATAEKHRAWLADPANLHRNCDHSPPEHQFRACLRPVVEGPTIEQRVVEPWTPVAP